VTQEGEDERSSSAVPTEAVAPTRTDPFARQLCARLWWVGGGGRVGRPAPPHRWWTPLRVLLALTAVVFALAIVQHEPCLRTNWSSNEARYGKMCYSDVPYLYTGRGLVEGLWPYADNHGRYQVMEYPVGISYVAWLTAKVVQLRPEGPSVEERHHHAPDEQWSLPGMSREVDTYFLLTAMLMFGFGLLTTWFLAGTHRGRPWDALPFVLSPSLLMTGLINWDLVAVALTAGALWAWARGRPGLTGVMIGLGAATKLYPLFLLGPVLLIAWRRRRFSGVAVAFGAAAVSWVLANLPALLTGRAQWQVFWDFNKGRGADLGSIWLALDHRGVHLDVAALNLWSWVPFLVACGLVGVLALAAPRTPRFAQLGLLVMVAFVVFNKVYSPQYVLWLLPLAVLARPRWRDLIIWQVGELLYMAAVWLYLGGWLQEGAGGASPAYDVAIWLRIVAELYLVAVVVRDVLRPEHDVVEPMVRTDPPVRARPGFIGAGTAPP
jgi:uncharacterized membrane protein